MKIHHFYNKIRHSHNESLISPFYFLYFISNKNTHITHSNQKGTKFICFFAIFITHLYLHNFAPTENRRRLFKLLTKILLLKGLRIKKRMETAICFFREFLVGLKYIIYLFTKKKIQSVCSECTEKTLQSVFKCDHRPKPSFADRLPSVKLKCKK